MERVAGAPVNVSAGDVPQPPLPADPSANDVSRRTGLALLALILAGGALLRLWMLAHDVPTVDSDEATFGLMALHMLHGEWTAVMWGQTYMGSLEPTLLAPLLWIFGTTTVTLRLASLLLGLAFIASTYALCTQVSTRRIGLLSAALLAFGPPFFVVLSVRTFGGYVETLLFGNVLLLLALRGDSPAGRQWWMVGLTGLVAGVALWTDVLIGPYLLAAGVIFVWQRRRDLLGRNGVVLAATTLLGVSPFVLFEIFSGGGTARAIATSTLSGTGTPGAPAATQQVALVALHNPLHELFASLPILLGSGLGGTQSTGLAVGDYLLLASRYPLVYGVNLLIVGGTLGFVALAARDVFRQRHLLLATARAGTKRMPLLVQYEAAVLLVCSCYGVAVLVYRDMNFAAPRYLLPFFAATPLVVRQADVLAQRLWAGRARLIRFWRGRAAEAARVPTIFETPKLPTVPLVSAVPAALLVGLFGVIIIWNLVGDLTLRPIQTAALDQTVWVYGNDAPLLNALYAHHVRTLVTDDYWIGMRLSFQSGETVIPVIADGAGNLGLNRYAPYVVQGLADHRPAFVELAGTPGAAVRQRAWQAGRYPGYTQQRIGAYLVFLPA